MDKLEVYNLALDQLGGKRLESLTQRRESRLILDGEWDNALAYCLEQAIWIFALRTVSATATALPTLNYGFSNAFSRPADCIYTYMLAPTVAFEQPQRDVLEADGFYFGRSGALFARYTSNETIYGLNPALWTAAFAEYLSTYLALKTCLRITRSADLTTELATKMAYNLAVAKAKDAVVVSTGPVPYNMLARREYSPGGDIEEMFPFVTPSK